MKKKLFLAITLVLNITNVFSHDLSRKETKEYNNLISKISYTVLSTPVKHNFFVKGRNKLDFYTSSVYKYLKKINTRPALVLLNEYAEICEYVNRAIVSSGFNLYEADYWLDKALKVNNKMVHVNILIFVSKAFLYIDMHSCSNSIKFLNKALKSCSGINIKGKTTVYNNLKAFICTLKGACYWKVGNKKQSNKDFNIAKKFAYAPDVKALLFKVISDCF